MKRKIITLATLVLIGIPLGLLAQIDHLILTEVVLQPSDGEYVRIENPTSQTVNLGDYYLTDATDQANGKYYYNLPSGTDYWSGGSTDFLVRLPNQDLAAGASIVIGLSTAARYQTAYGTLPDLALKEDFTGQTSIGNALYGFLANTTETLVLFNWDAVSATVKDVDYLLWGDSTFAVDKSAVSGYLADTPIPNQSHAPVPAGGEKLIRAANSEGTEASTGGNGITGHDETSENMANTWIVTILSVTKPVITDFVFTPAAPTPDDPVNVSATVVDTSGLASVTLYYFFAGDTTALAMTNTAGDTYTAQIPATGAEGTLGFFILAINTSDISTKSSTKGATIETPPAPLTIGTVRANIDSYVGQNVTFNAVVSVGSGIIRTDRTSMYIQDVSGYGINLNQTGLLNPPLVRGDSVSVTGTVDVYVSSSTGDETVQLSTFTYTVLGHNKAVPNVRSIDVAQLNTLVYEGSLVKMSGVVTSRSDGIGGGSNIILEDAYGATTVRVWDTTNMLDDPTADSLLQVGMIVEIGGVGSSYRSEGQLLAAYAQDVREKPEGEAGSGATTLKVNPFPFVPQLGERIKYTYSFPAYSRITLRIFDASGRYITTLFDDFRPLALIKTD
ncbi:MAG TPA: hypothetical protein DHU63_09650, partial [Candidatus Marinimicrobia bacterium]|nr:hypothetical protein [Candidatus Neomarinimicrobiota bacterium]